jgi:fructose-1,6-bisphosphatase
MKPLLGEGRVMKTQKYDKKLHMQEMPMGSALDLYKRVGAVAHKVPAKGKLAEDSMLAVYKDRVTYTFILGKEVASVHYDRKRGEIYFSGHNIRNMELSDEQRQALMDMGMAMQADEKAKEFSSSYDATLARVLADNK